MLTNKERVRIAGFNTIKTGCKSCLLKYLTWNQVYNLPDQQAKMPIQITIKNDIVFI